MGKQITIEYRTSTDYFIEAENSSHPWSNHLPISVPVVSRVATSVTKADFSVDDYVTEYSYWDGYYDGIEKEFRGFGYVEVKDVGNSASTTKITHHWFDTGKDTEALKGKPLRQEISDENGKFFNRTENDWTTRQIALGTNNQPVVFAYNDQIETIVDEGTGNPVHLRTGYDYDNYGNVSGEFKYGMVDPDFGDSDPNGLRIGDDEVLIYSDCGHNTSDWVLDGKWREQTKDIDGNLHAESLSYYDELPLGQVQEGNLTSQQSWLNTEGRHIRTVKNEYDTFGKSGSGLYDTVLSAGENKLDLEKAKELLQGAAVRHPLYKNPAYVRLSHARLCNFLPCRF